MKKLIGIIAILLIGCAQLTVNEQNDENENSIVHSKLIGKWISDKEKTMEWIDRNRKLPEKVYNLLYNILGKLIVEIQKDKVITYYEGTTDEDEVFIIDEDHNSLAVWYFDSITDEYEIQLMRFENDNLYSVYVEKLEIREYFKRIN
jgi:hypothetical protein